MVLVWRGPRRGPRGTGEALGSPVSGAPGALPGSQLSGAPLGVVTLSQEAGPRRGTLFALGRWCGDAFMTPVRSLGGVYRQRTRVGELGEADGLSGLLPQVDQGQVVFFLF